MQAQRNSIPRAAELSGKLQQALAVMIEAAEYAEQTSGDPWEFAVEIHQLRDLGLSNNDLRYLVRLQYLDHASELTASTNNGREFRPIGDLSFTKRSCFALTLSGYAAAKGCRASSKLEYPPVRLCPIRIAVDADQIMDRCPPLWDAQRHVLTFDTQIVKRFRWRALNQELILSAFQEEGWPARIDDPLPSSRCVDRKRRLSDTIKCLNRGHEHKVIHFHGDGTGQGVIWESVAGHASRGKFD